MKKIKIKKYVAVLTSAAMIFTGISASAAKKNITFVKSKQTVYVGKKLTLKVNVPKKYKNKTSKIKWSSSNTKVAVVNKKGVVTAKKKGSVVIKAVFYGTTAKCTVSVKQKAAVTPTAKPEESSMPTAKPEESSTPTAKPEESSAPTVKPEESSTPTAKPEESSAPTAKPTIEPTPTATTEPAASAAPEQSAKPTQTPDDNSNKLIKGSSDGAVAAYGVIKDGKNVTTVYLLNKNYSGKLNFSFKGNAITQSASVKDVLLTLDTTCITRTNSAKTIKVSRESFDSAWVISDLVDGKDYSFTVERTNTFDTSYKNCGAIYFSGDVTGVISIY